MSYGRIGVIGAMDSELAALIAALAQPAQETVQGLIFHTGRLGAREVVLVRCGIGKVSAARCTQVLIDRFAPGAVINTGIAGGLARQRCSRPMRRCLPCWRRRPAMRSARSGCTAA